jgi:DNA-binding NtrC family response regulator
MKVLCMSGYGDAVGERDDADIAYLQKPFTAEALASAARRALDGAEHGESTSRET